MAHRVTARASYLGIKSPLASKLSSSTIANCSTDSILYEDEWNPSSKPYDHNRFIGLHMHIIYNSFRMNVCVEAFHLLLGVGKLGSCKTRLS